MWRSLPVCGRGATDSLRPEPSTRSSPLRWPPPSSLQSSRNFSAGAGVIAKQTGKNLFASLVLLTRRNTRRYWRLPDSHRARDCNHRFCRNAFNQSHEQEMSLHSKLLIGPYELNCEGFSQDSNANYDSEFAILNVSSNGKAGANANQLGVRKFADDARAARLSGQPPSRRRW